MALSPQPDEVVIDSVRRRIAYSHRLRNDRVPTSGTRDDEDDENKLGMKLPKLLHCASATGRPDLPQPTAVVVGQLIIRGQSLPGVFRSLCAAASAVFHSAVPRVAEAEAEAVLYDNCEWGT